MVGYDGIDYTEINKIDSAITTGLLGVEDSLGYRIEEIEKHFHSNERWFGLAKAPNLEVHRADRIGVGVVPFQIDAGAADWGAWVQIFGSADTPADTGMVYFDPHRLLVTDMEANATYFFQFAYNTSGAAALTALTYTECVLQPLSNQIDSGPFELQSVRITATTKSWARCMVPSQQSATMDFYIGLHEYRG